MTTSASLPPIAAMFEAAHKAMAETPFKDLLASLSTNHSSEEYKLNPPIDKTAFDLRVLDNHHAVAFKAASSAEYVAERKDDVSPSKVAETFVDAYIAARIKLAGATFDSASDPAGS